jgi:hypothetical protein
MNSLYLIKDEKRNYCLFKVGFATDLNTRLYAYTTHNPECQCISTVKTQLASGRNIEKLFHSEIEKRGYEFVTAIIDGKRTEWFKVPYSDPFFGELSAKGLNAFKCGKNRKNYGTFTVKVKG